MDGVQISAISRESVLDSADWAVWPDGQRRFVYCWGPRDPKGYVGIVHGLGEHGGRYAELATQMASRGYFVAAYDQQGHGHDPGKRGVITSYQSLLHDVGQLLSWLRLQARGRPCFLFGHSMGGNLVTNYVLREKVLPTAVIASSPMFRSPREPRGPFNWIARLALRIAPNLCIGAGIRFEDLTDDPIEQRQVASDPLYHRRVSLRLGAELIDSGRWAIENADQFKRPILITHSPNDRLTKATGSAAFAAKAGSICQMVSLENHRHETFRDLDKRAVWELLISYLDSHQKVASR